jgi:hypothetical protein
MLFFFVSPHYLFLFVIPSNEGYMNFLPIPPLVQTSALKLTMQYTGNLSR